LARQKTFANPPLEKFIHEKKMKKHLEDCNVKVVARPSSCIHNVEENMNSVDVEQELLVNDNNSTSSTVCMPAYVTIKEEEASPSTKRVRLDYDDSKSVLP